MRIPEEALEYLQKNNKEALKKLAEKLSYIEEAALIHHGHSLYRERVNELRMLLRKIFDITAKDIREIEEKAEKASKEIKTAEKGDTFGVVPIEQKKSISTKAMIGSLVIAFGTGLAAPFVVKKIKDSSKKKDGKNPTEVLK